MKFFLPFCAANSKCVLIIFICLSYYIYIIFIYCWWSYLQMIPHWSHDQWHILPICTKGTKSQWVISSLYGVLLNHLWFVQLFAGVNIFSTFECIHFCVIYPPRLIVRCPISDKIVAIYILNGFSYDSPFYNIQTCIFLDTQVSLAPSQVSRTAIKRLSLLNSGGNIRIP